MTDGPYTEAKDIVSGYMVIDATDLSQALELAKGCANSKMSAAIRKRAGRAGLRLQTGCVLFEQSQSMGDCEYRKIRHYFGFCCREPLRVASYPGHQA
ncbi:YciI family protein [Tunturiibacter psychrotolerans]|uniref:YciI family protein n=1 Tax=Tunturiibacter psychrotolerans TaxID=3069686 RepID=UPI003D23F6AB